eukprot:7945322-Pyramimonas_sp.AAC.1
MSNFVMHRTPRVLSDPRPLRSGSTGTHASSPPHEAPELQDAASDQFLLLGVASNGKKGPWDTQ